MPTVSFVTPENVASPNGVSSYWDDMCVSPCVSVINTSLALLHLSGVSEFDTVQNEAVTLTFDKSYFSDRIPRYQRLLISPDGLDPLATGYGLGVVFQLATLSNTLAMPLMIDAQIVALFAQRPCETVEHLTWFPTAPQLSFLMAGDSVFDLTWRAVAAVGGLVFLGVSAMGLFPVQLHSRTMSRAVLPLVLIQIVNVWYSPLLFASAYLLSYGFASYQIWGAFLLTGVVGLGITCLVQICADPTAVFIQMPPAEGLGSGFVQRLVHFVTRRHGRWVTPRYCILVNQGELWFLRHMNRVLLPYFFGGGSLRFHLIFVGLNTIMIIGVGIQSRTPTGCFVQGCVIAGYLFLSSFAVLSLGFSSPVVKGLTFAIRLVTVGQLIPLVALPTFGFRVLFVVTTCINIVLLIVRASVIGFVSYAEGICTSCEKPSRDEPVVGLRPHRARSLIKRERHVEAVGVPLDSHASDQNDFDVGLLSLPEKEEAESSEDDTPGWLAKGTHVKPKARKQDRLEVPSPVWYPGTRSNVRTTNDADCELDLSPYTVRTTRKRLPL